MADTITDNRTLIVNADSATPWDDLTGVAAGTLDTSTFIQGSGSITYSQSNSRAGLLYDAGTTQSAWANSHFYLWVNCGVVGLLLAKASGGLTVRFCGNTVTDFFEFYVGGNDSWPESIEGGWVQFVVDIEGTASNTGGTPPATNACRYVGITANLTTMPKMADNMWIDEIRRLGDGTPGILVQGRNGGTTDWDSADIVTQLGTGAGMFRPATGGAYALNAPIQFGANDTSTHGFTDTNAIWLWEDQEWAADDLYQISALGNSGGTTNVTWGVKTGTGDDATGAQGLTIAGATTGPIWDMDFDDPNLDTIGMYGCTFINGGDFQLDDPAVSCISTSYVNCDSATVSNSEQLRVNVIDADTADGVAFMTTDDLGDIVFSNFAFSDGHGVELTTPRVATQTSKGNIFTGYGTGNDAEIYNNTAGAVTINVTNGGTTVDYRNGTSATTTVNNTVTLTVTVKDTGGTAIQSARVRIEQTDGTLISNGSTNASGVYQDTTYNYVTDTAVRVNVRKSSSADDPRYKDNQASGTITSSGLSVEFTMIEDTIAA